MKIPGIYVEIRGDSTQLGKDIGEAKTAVTKQAREMSDAINNALSSSQISKAINNLTSKLGTLSRSAHLSGQSFDNLGVNLIGLSKLTGITDAEFAKLQSRLLATQAANEQEKSLKGIAIAAGLSRTEIQAMGTQFGLSTAQIQKVTLAVHGAEVQIQTLSARIAAMPPIKNYTTLVDSSLASLTAQAGASLEKFALNLVAMADGVTCLLYTSPSPRD